MDINSIGITPPVTAVSIIALAIALLAVAAAFTIRPFLRRIKASMVGSELLVICAILVAAMGIMFGVGHSLQLERQADQEAFTTELKSVYGVTTGASFSDVQTAANWERTIVLSDSVSDFEARPRLDGSRLTFFRVDNGKAVEKIAS